MSEICQMVPEFSEKSVFPSHPHNLNKVEKVCKFIAFEVMSECIADGKWIARKFHL